MRAEEVYNNFLIYKEYLRDNNLDDDSDSITVENLMDFCEEYIDKEYYMLLWNTMDKRING